MNEKMNSTLHSGLQFSPCDYVFDTKTAANIAKYTEILGILSIASPIFSIIGTGSVIVFVVYHRICKSPDISSFFHLSIADLLLALFWVVGPIIHFSFHTHLEATDNLGKFCVVWQALCEMVHIMSFFLTINYAFNVFLRMKEKKDILYESHMDDDIMASQQRARYSNMMKTTGYLFSWLLPVVLIIPLLKIVLKQESSCQMCIILLDAPRPTAAHERLLDYNGFVLMIVTLGFSIIAIIVLYLCTLRMYRKTLLGFHTNRERVVIHAMTKRATAYIIVFAYCWTPALILSALGLKNAYESSNTNKGPLFLRYFPLYVVQTLSAPLQGFLNSLVYGWSRRTFREAVTRESRRWLNHPNYGTVEDSPSTSLLASTEIKTPESGRRVSIE